MRRGMTKELFDKPNIRRDRKALIKFVQQELSEELERQSIENLARLVKQIKKIKHGK
jgi:predicted secreted protein